MCFSKGIYWLNKKTVMTWIMQWVMAWEVNIQYKYNIYDINHEINYDLAGQIFNINTTFILSSGRSKYSIDWRCFCISPEINIIIIFNSKYSTEWRCFCISPETIIIIIFNSKYTMDWRCFCISPEIQVIIFNSKYGLRMFMYFSWNTYNHIQ